MDGSQGGSAAVRDEGRVPPREGGGCVRLPQAAAPSAERPTMGRVVHFVDEEGEAMPAMVRAGYEGDPDLCDLTAFGDFGIRIENRVRRSDEHSPLSWHWPERGA